MDQMLGEQKQKTECSSRGEHSTAEEMLGRSPLIRVTAVGGWCGEEIRNWIRKRASRV